MKDHLAAGLVLDLATRVEWTRVPLVDSTKVHLHTSHQGLTNHPRAHDLISHHQVLDLIKDLLAAVGSTRDLQVFKEIDHLLITSHIMEVLVQTFLLASLTPDLHHLEDHMKEWDPVITILKLTKIAMIPETS